MIEEETRVPSLHVIVGSTRTIKRPTIGSWPSSPNRTRECRCTGPPCTCLPLYNAPSRCYYHPTGRVVILFFITVTYSLNVCMLKAL